MQLALGGLGRLGGGPGLGKAVVPAGVVAQDEQDDGSGAGEHGPHAVLLTPDGKSLVETAGDYGDEGYIYQELLDLPNFDGNYPVLGCWIVDGEPAGMGIREGGLVTNNTARFVPHVFQSR